MSRFTDSAIIMLVVAGAVVVNRSLRRLITVSGSLSGPAGTVPEKIFQRSLLRCAVVLGSALIRFF